MESPVWLIQLAAETFLLRSSFEALVWGYPYFLWWKVFRPGALPTVRPGGAIHSSGREDWGGLHYYYHFGIRWNYLGLQWMIHPFTWWPYACDQSTKGHFRTTKASFSFNSRQDKSFTMVLHRNSIVLLIFNSHLTCNCTAMVTNCN